MDSRSYKRGDVQGEEKEEGPVLEEFKGWLEKTYQSDETADRFAGRSNFIRIKAVRQADRISRGLTHKAGQQSGRECHQAVCGREKEPAVLRASQWSQYQRLFVQPYRDRQS